MRRTLPPILSLCVGAFLAFGIEHNKPIDLTTTSHSRFLTLEEAAAAYEQAEFEASFAALERQEDQRRFAELQRQEAERAAAEQVAQAQQQAAVARSARSGGVWHRLRVCESGNSYTKNTGNGYYGAYQFAAPTWRSMGTGYSHAHLAPPEVQDDAARRLQARSGWGQWPACSRKLRLR